MQVLQCPWNTAELVCVQYSEYKAAQGHAIIYTYLFHQTSQKASFLKLLAENDQDFLPDSLSWSWDSSFLQAGMTASELIPRLCFFLSQPMAQPLSTEKIHSLTRRSREQTEHTTAIFLMPTSLHCHFLIYNSLKYPKKFPSSAKKVTVFNIS